MRGHRENPFLGGFFTGKQVYGDYVKESIDFIQKHEPPEGYFVGFSGGKDSIVTLELVRMAGVEHHAYYSCTGIDPPEIYTFIRQHYPEVVWLYPKMSFLAGIRKKGVPIRTHRWCCDILKKNPSKRIPLKHRIMGIRAEESYKRANRGEINKFGKITRYHPIFNWMEWQVWEFIEESKLPYPSLYDQGFNRIGCVICPFLSKKGKEIAKAQWPKMYQVFEKVVRGWWTPGKYKDFQTADEFLEFWYSS